MGPIAIPVHTGLRVPGAGGAVAGGRLPRIIPAMGLFGAPFLLAATIAAALGLVAVGSFWFIWVLPIALWERSVGIWMTFKGFSPSPLTAAAP